MTKQKLNRLLAIFLFGSCGLSTLATASAQQIQQVYGSEKVVPILIIRGLIFLALMVVVIWLARRVVNLALYSDEVIES